MTYKQFIENDIIYLKGITQEDVTINYIEWMNDSDINSYLETRFIYQSETQIRQFVQEKTGCLEEQLFGIFVKDGSKHIGNIKLGPINWIHRRADISLLIGDKNWWGKGIATQAIDLISSFAITTLNLNKLMAGAYKDNKGSIRAFQKCGYQIEGEVKDYALKGNQGITLIQLGITANQFNEKR